MDETLKKRVYSPYSNTVEYCIVEGKSGIHYPGVRVENISFPLTISAVQGAICSCLGNGDEPHVLYQPEPTSELLNYWVDEYNLSQEKELPDSLNLYDALISKTTDSESLLKELAKKSHTQHSNFPVAVLLDVSDGYICGVNVEVSSWSLGLCAERVAIFRAISAGFREFEKITVSAPKGDFSSPCGACRQVMAEWMPRQRVELHHGDGSLSTHNIAQLLPHGFTSGNLKK
ncbi:MAG: cytidine deaminase [Balneolaceae bacterium]